MGGRGGTAGETGGVDGKNRMRLGWERGVGPPAAQGMGAKPGSGGSPQVSCFSCDRLANYSPGSGGGNDLK